MPSRRSSLASGHSGNHSCSKRPSGRTVGFMGLTLSGESGRSVFIPRHVQSLPRTKSDISGDLGGTPKGLYRASEASSLPLALPTLMVPLMDSSSSPPTVAHFSQTFNPSPHACRQAQTPPSTVTQSSTSSTVYPRSWSRTVSAPRVLGVLISPPGQQPRQRSGRGRRAGF